MNFIEPQQQQQQQLEEIDDTPQYSLFTNDTDNKQHCSKSHCKNLDYPPYSRLFVLYPKTATEDELKDEFEKYGPIEDTWVVKDKETGLPKGIAYIKFTKASHAAKAIEDLNGKLLNNKHAKPLKVIISNSKNDKKQLNSSSTTDMVIDNDRMLRLFVVIPKEFRKKDLRDAFKKFGEIENVQIIFNRLTNENKGFGYVRFYKASDAARALEECHPKFKPKFAEPYSAKLARERETSNSTKECLLLSQNNSSSLSTSNSLTTFGAIGTSLKTTASMPAIIGGGTTVSNSQRLISSTSAIGSTVSSSSSSSINRQLTQVDDSNLLIKCSSTLPVSHLHNLFNLIPGLAEFKPVNLSVMNGCFDIYYLAKYENEYTAAYAYDKLNKFQYPTGEVLNIVKL